MEKFRDELYEHLDEFCSHGGLPKLPVTLTGHPRQGLTLAYRLQGRDPAGPEEIIKEASKVGASLGVGAGVGVAAGVVIGKFVFGSVVSRVGIASAGVAIGVPILSPLAVIGGVAGSMVYGLYKLGKWRRDKEAAEEYAKELITHMEGFSPSTEWPSVEIYVSVPELGLSAFWDPKRK